MTDPRTTVASNTAPPWHLSLLGALAVALTLAGPHVHRDLGDLAFNAWAVSHGLLALLATRIALRTDRRIALWTILIAAVAMRLALLPVHPHLSSDAFRYVWDGRVQGAGINPYRYLPAAPELAFLRDAAIYPFINRADYAITIYPPAAQMLFFVINRIADGLIPLKLAFIAFEGLTAAILLDLLRRIAAPPQRIVAYAWHPLAVWEIAGSAHIDAPMVALAMLGIWLVVAKGRYVLAAVAITVAAFMKPLALLALPIAWRPPDWRAPLVAVLVIPLLYLPYLSIGWGMFSFVPGYLREESIERGDGFWPVWLLNGAFGQVAWFRTAYLILAAALLLVLALRLSLAHAEPPEARLRRLAWLVFAGILAASPNYAWYWLFLVPFVALFGSISMWTVTIGAYVLYDEVWGDPHVDRITRDGVLHVAIVIALAVEWWRSRRRAVPPPSPGTGAS